LRSVGISNVERQEGTDLDEGVVEDKHHRCGIPSPGLSPEEHLPDITNISHFGMAETEFP
jgi:hypothetical protein